MRHLSIYEQNLYECVKIYGPWLGRPLGNNQPIRTCELVERRCRPQTKRPRPVPAGDAEEGDEGGLLALPLVR